MMQKFCCAQVLRISLEKCKIKSVNRLSDNSPLVYFVRNQNPLEPLRGTNYRMLCSLDQDELWCWIFLNSNSATSSPSLWHLFVVTFRAIDRPSFVLSLANIIFTWYRFLATFCGILIATSGSTAHKMSLVSVCWRSLTIDDWRLKRINVWHLQCDRRQWNSVEMSRNDFIDHGPANCLLHRRLANLVVWLTKSTIAWSIFGRPTGRFSGRHFGRLSPDWPTFRPTLICRTGRRHTAFPHASTSIYAASTLGHNMFRLMKIFNWISFKCILTSKCRVQCLQCSHVIFKKKLFDYATLLDNYARSPTHQP